MRSQLAVWALRHWALSRARLCMRAWREYTARVQADRANAAVRAIALQREPDRYSPVGSTAAERLAAAATSAAAAALAASRAWHERNDLAAGGAAPAVAAPANVIASAAGAPSGLVGARQPSPRGRPQSEVISGAQLGARQPSVNARASRPRPFGGNSPGTVPTGTAPIGTAPRPVDAPPDATKYVYYAPRIGIPPRRRQKSRKWAGAPSGAGPLLVAAAPPPAGDEEVKTTRIRRRLAAGP
jgi:hypothetical protein